MRAVILLVSFSLVSGAATPSFSQRGEQTPANGLPNQSRLPAETTPPVTKVALPTDVTGWLTRLRLAAQLRSYAGTLVVTNSAGHVAGSRVWHAFRDDRQIERVEALDGPPRTVFRRDGEMRTFLAASQMVVYESAIASSVFPKAQQELSGSINDFYSAERKGTERVASHDADVVWLVPKDALRFGYRVWSERDSGLVLKVQTVTADGHLLEQASFMQLELDAPVSFDNVSSAMDDVAGYQVVDSTRQSTGVDSKSPWTLREPIPGFSRQGCRVSPARPRTTQCSYADGLTSVSLFFENFGAFPPPSATARWAAGATRAIARPLNASTWLTVVGEVPFSTLVMFAERLKPSPD